MERRYSPYTFVFCTRKRRKRRKRNNTEIFTFGFSTFSKVGKFLGVCLKIKEQNFPCVCLAPFCCGYFGAIQDTILNPGYLCTRSATAFLDYCSSCKTHILSFHVISVNISDDPTLKYIINWNNRALRKRLGRFSHQNG